MTTIAILGTGNVARALAGPLAAAGHEITLGSRNPAAVTWPGAVARVVPLPDAPVGAEVVVNALPGAVSLEVLTGLAAALAGAVLIDVANPVEIGTDGFATRSLFPGSSLGAELQRKLPTTRVVKALNTMHESVMANPSAVADPLSVFLSGDDRTAKRIVVGLLRDLAWPERSIIDLGGIDTAWWPESFTLAVRPLIQALGPVPFGLAVAR